MTAEFLVHHTEVAAEGASPSRSMLVLHGILGSGGNWRSIARRLAERCPTWSFELVDLRAHGQSLDPPSPSTIDAAAEDLTRIETSLARPVAGVMGHSFGGKVALAYMRLRLGQRLGATRGQAALRPQTPGALDHAWILDSSPGPVPPDLRRGSTLDVLQTLESIEWPLPSRERFIELITSRGHSRAIADWLAMNVRRASDGFRLRLDLKTIRSLLEDYRTQDLWGTITAEGAARAIHVVLGGRSSAVPPGDKARFEDLARAGAVHLHLLPEAGHWLHADDPEGLLNIMSGALGP